MLEKKQYLKVEDKFDYLLHMPMYSVCKEKVDELKKENKELNEHLTYIKNISTEDLWKKELVKLRKNSM